ncbi:MAG: response regulator, partial [Chloroflexota bacterium]
ASCQMSNLILVIEDNRMIRAMHSAGFSGFGYDVLEAASLQEAEHLLCDGEQPDVVITSDELQDGTADDVIDMVSTYLGHGQARTIVSSGHTSMAVSGADAVLCKPAGIIEMVDLIR